MCTWADGFYNVQIAYTTQNTQIRTILMPPGSLQGVTLQCEGLLPDEVSLLYEAIACKMSMWAQDASLQLWSLTSAAAPKRLRADIENIQRDTKAMGEQLKGILALNAAEALNMTFQAEYVTDKDGRWAFCAFSTS
jgi:hypothetical protein